MTKAQKEQRRYRARRASMIRRLAAIADRERRMTHQQRLLREIGTSIRDLWAHRLIEKFLGRPVPRMKPPKPTIEVIPELMICVPITGPDRRHWRGRTKHRAERTMKSGTPRQSR